MYLQKRRRKDRQEDLKMCHGENNVGHGRSTERNLELIYACRGNKKQWWDVEVCVYQQWNKAIYRETTIREKTMMKRRQETKENKSWSCVYRSQMSGGNCAVGLFSRHLAAESSVFSHKVTSKNPSEELHIIPLGALLKAGILGSFKSFRLLLSSDGICRWFVRELARISFFKSTSNPFRFKYYY